MLVQCRITNWLCWVGIRKCGGVRKKSLILVSQKSDLTVNYVGVLCEFGEQKEEAFKTGCNRHPKLLHKAVGLRVLLSFTEVVLTPEGRIRNPELWDWFIEGQWQSQYHLSHHDTAVSSHYDFSTLHYHFYKVTASFLLSVLLWEEWKGLCAREQLFSIL